MENSISIMRPELVAEWSSRNLPLTPEEVSYGSNKLYWWIGACGHEWQTSAKARSCGEKCPVCANARIIPGINDLLTLEPELAKEWSDKNKPFEPTMIGPGSHKKVIWHGKCGHEWEAPIRNRVKGAGCPYCSHNIVLPGFNDLQTLLPEFAREWSDRNLPMLPSQVTAHVNRKVWWRCSKGHEWNTLISTRSYGSKCPYCSGIITLKGFNDFATLHPDLAAEWSDRNGDLKPDAINERSTKNVWWKCSVCGNEWKSVVKSRVRGRVCPVCADREVLAGYDDLATTDPELLGEWDYEMNKDVEPTSISRNSMRPVWWKCKEGHSWKDRMSNRAIEVRFCAACEAEFRRVLPQLLIMLYCGRNGLKPRINDEDTIGVPLDAYIPDLKLAFLAIGRGTKTETDTQAIAKHLCERRGIVLEAVSYRASSESLCVDIKRAFQEAHVYFTSDFEKDIEIAHTQFYRWRRR